MFRRLRLVVTLVERLAEADGLEVVGVALLALGREALLGDELLGVDGLLLAVGILAAEGEDDRRVEVIGDGDKA